MGKGENLIGQKFGKLTVLYRDEDRVSASGKKSVIWHCKCDCGNEVNVKAANLKRGSTKSCGCSQGFIQRSFKDRSGERYGRLLVLYRAPDYISPKGKHIVQWHCLCDCGKECIIGVNSLRNGKSASCGCLRKEITHNRLFEDLSGKQFGRLTVQARGDDHVSCSGERRVKWICKCECGNTILVTAHDLKSGHTLSCGCYKRDIITQCEELVGRKFGKLTVISRAPNYIRPNGQAAIMWHCKCECGGTCIVSSGHLKDGHTQSCGCNGGKFIDLTGQRFSKLTVMNRADDYINPGGQHTTMWHCKCDCGNEIDVAGTSLKTGATSSCGCYKQSKLELLVNNYFQANGYIINEDYVTQMRFDDLKGVGGGMLSYDFAYFEEGKIIYLIECQGNQHFEPVDYFGGEETFEIQKIHDRLKKNYAEEHGIKLLEIDYTLDTYEKVSAVLDKYIVYRQ